jgi:hypothetical protein
MILSWDGGMIPHKHCLWDRQSVNDDGWAVGGTIGGGKAGLCRFARHFATFDRRRSDSTMKAIALILVVATMGLANAARLDIHAEGITRPTIKSEMSRGNRVGFKCSVGVYGARQARTCLEKAIDANVQLNTATDAFRLGLYFSAWKYARINAELSGDEDWTYFTICDVRNVQKYRSNLGPQYGRCYE